MGISSRLHRRNVVSGCIAFAVLCSALLAFSQNSNNADSSANTPESTTTLSVATSNLVAETVADSAATRVTGGYVPGVGMVVTAEVQELDIAEIGSWTNQLLINAGIADHTLPDGEQIVFLLDIAEPARTSRLVSFDPAQLNATGQMDRNDAPAVSTAPLRPVFETAPAE